jgi:hypothetical protein
MSIDSTATPPPLSSFKNRLDLNLQQNKPLKSTLSQADHLLPSRHSITVASKDPHHQQRFGIRQRTMSASQEGSTDTVTELTSMPSYATKHQNKRDRRSTDLKLPVEHHDQTAADRRNSIPQLYLSALFPNAFRHTKHHQKNNTK